MYVRGEGWKEGLAMRGFRISQWEGGGRSGLDWIGFYRGVVWFVYTRDRLAGSDDLDDRWLD